MRTRTTAAVILGVTAAAAVAGCSSGGAGASPATSSTTPTSVVTTGAAASSAPKVAHPLDASTLVQTPCSALAASDLTALDINEPTSKALPDSEGTGCHWTGTDGPANGLGVDWETSNKNGLSDLYAQKSDAGYWIPTTVSGYPGVFADLNGDLRTQGTCVINVGVSDNLYFFAMYNGGSSGSGTACSRAQQAAADVIKNLGGS